MLTRIWRGVTEGLFGRRAVFVVADDAASAEAKFLAHSKYAAPFEVFLHEEFETPVPGCEHPHARRVFW